MRYCKNFYCDQMGERICCVSCPWVKDCSNPCLNHPSRCGLENVDKKNGGPGHGLAPAPTEETII